MEAPLLAAAFEIASQLLVGIWGLPCECVIPSIESLYLLCSFESYPSGYLYVPRSEQCD
jgi:hypothetical protein